jgi:septal ring-binding cell division protein DamX
MMNINAFLTFVALVIIGIGSAYAQNVKTSVPEYDQKNTANLTTQSGFVGLQVGEELTKDNQQRHGTDFMQPTEVHQSEQNPMVSPAAPVIVMEQPPVVNVEKVIIGNTDTGVDLDKIKPQLEREY